MGDISPGSPDDAARNERCATYRLRGLVVFYGKHYVCFMASESRREWLLLDDSRVLEVGTWADVQRKCIDSRYQPTILMYEQMPASAIVSATGSGAASRNVSPAPAPPAPAPRQTPMSPSSAAATATTTVPGSTYTYAPAPGPRPTPLPAPTPQQSTVYEALAVREQPRSQQQHHGSITSPTAAAEARRIRQAEDSMLRPTIEHLLASNSSTSTAVRRAGSDYPMMMSGTDTFSDDGSTDDGARSAYSSMRHLPQAQAQAQVQARNIAAMAVEGALRSPFYYSQSTQPAGGATAAAAPGPERPASPSAWVAPASQAHIYGPSTSPSLDQRGRELLNQTHRDNVSAAENALQRISAVTDYLVSPTGSTSSSRSAGTASGAGARPGAKVIATDEMVQGMGPPPPLPSTRITPTVTSPQTGAAASSTATSPKVTSPLSLSKSLTGTEKYKVFCHLPPEMSSVAPRTHDYLTWLLGLIVVYDYTNRRARVGGIYAPASGMKPLTNQVQPGDFLVSIAGRPLSVQSKAEVGTGYSMFHMEKDVKTQLENEMRIAQSCNLPLVLGFECQKR